MQLFKNQTASKLGLLKSPQKEIHWKKNPAVATLLRWAS